MAGFCLVVMALLFAGVSAIWGFLPGSCGKIALTALIFSGAFFITLCISEIK